MNALNALTPSLAALLVFTGWMILLLAGIAGARVAKVLSGAAKANEFPSGVPHGGDAYWRLNRAHMNAVEFLPLFGAVVLVAAVIGFESASFDKLAWLVPAARVGQSLTHVASGSSAAVNLRFSLFLVQLACVIVMGLLVAGLV